MFTRNRIQRRRLGSELLESRNLLSVSPFPSDAGLYQIYSNHGQTGLMDPASGQFQNTANRAGQKVNAVGFRAADNYAYGMLTASHELGRVGFDGSVENLGSIEGLPTDQGTYFVGDFADDDLLWIRNGREMQKLYGVNVETKTVDSVVTTNASLHNIFDIAFNPVDGLFYASRRGPENELISISKETGEVTTIGQNGLQKLTFGAMYADAEGTIFGGANQTGEVYTFDKVTGLATKVGQGPTSGTNDGFSNFTTVLEVPPSVSDDFFASELLDKVVGNVMADNGSGLDVDGNSDELTVVAVDGNTDLSEPITIDSGATVTMSQDGSFEYDPRDVFDDLAPGETTTDSFSYTVADDTGRSDTANVSVEVTGVGVAGDFTGIEVKGLAGREGVKTPINVGDFNGDGWADAVVSSPGAGLGSGETYVIFGSETGIPWDLDVNTLRSRAGGDGSAGVILQGTNINDRSGVAVDAAGDVNGDGYADIVIGASDADPNGTNSGRVYIVYGGAAFDAEMKLSLIEDGDGSLGYVANGINAHDLAGTVVAGVGDLNSDGYADVAISSRHADVGTKRNAGQTWVLFGKPNASATVELSSLLESNGGDGSDGFVISGTNKHDHLGSHVEGGVDLNGDGYDDMLVTAPNADVDALVDVGATYVIYGRGGGSQFEAEIDTKAISRTGNTKGFVIVGNTRKSNEGGYVRISDDVNSDGTHDLIVGMGNPNRTGTRVLLCGAGMPNKVSVASLATGSKVFLDNFDSANPDYDSRPWDQYIHSATLHSDEGTSVTIWGDPHVVITIDGVTERFDIGYGAGSIAVSDSTTINWDTIAYDPANPDRQLPLSAFEIDMAGTENDMQIDAGDGVDVVDHLTGLTDADIREFAAQLRTYAGLATAPLQKNTV